MILAFYKERKMKGFKMGQITTAVTALIFTLLIPGRVMAGAFSLLEQQQHVIAVGIVSVRQMMYIRAGILKTLDPQV